MSFLTIVPKSDRRSAPGSVSESHSSSSDSAKLTPVPAISDSDKSSPGILVLAPPLHLLHMNARAMELMNSHLNAGTADTPTPKVATGLLPATVLELCKDVFALLQDRSTSKDWERFEVRRFIGAPRHHLLLRGFAVPDPRGAKHSRVVVLVEPAPRPKDMIDSQAVQRFGFTPREKAVIKYLSQGATNKEIARELRISLPTVKEHIRHIMEKTKSSTRTGALVQILGTGAQECS